jgi:aryl-alcohol dehydrogenase-like predicted oxidoreductase
VQPEAQAAILGRAAAAGIDLLDTAAGYGASESALGHRLAETGLQTRFRIVTKTWPIRTDDLTTADLDAIAARFEASLTALCVPAVDTLLVHDSRDLMGRGGERLWALMERWRGGARVRHLGVSVYSGAEAETVRARFPVETVQLPLNALDQRALGDASLARLAAAGVVVHVRSAYLQGLLLSPPDRVPERLAALAPRLERFQGAARQFGLSPAALALGFVATRPGVSAVVIGVQSEAELAAAIAAHGEGVAALAHPAPQLDLAALACDEPALIDPRRW